MSSDREVHLRQLRQDAALELSEDSPAIFKGEEQNTDVPSRLQEWQPVLEFKEKHSSVSGSSGAELAEWELLSPSRASICGSSPRSFSVADCEAANLLEAENELPVNLDGPEENVVLPVELQNQVLALDELSDGEVCVSSVQESESGDDITDHSLALEPLLVPAASDVSVDDQQAFEDSFKCVMDSAERETSGGRLTSVDKSSEPEGDFSGYPAMHFSSKLGKAGHESAAKVWNWFSDCIESFALVSSRPVFAFSSNQARSQLFQFDWGKVTLGASIAVLGAVVLGVVYQNRKLTRVLKQKDREVAKLVMKILSLQDTLQGSRRVPLVRHTAWAIFPSEFM